MAELQPVPHVFDLDAGRACLDFANTRSSSVDHLTSYADLLAFAAQARLVTADDAAWLRAEAARQPTAAQATFARALTLRDALRRIFLALANDQLPAAADLGALNDELAVSLAQARVVLGSSGIYAWGWAGLDLGSPMWPVVRSAAEVLTSDQDPALVRECGASDCRWLFVDVTRNRSRQWCSMASCGNREKARRHYQRTKASRALSGVDASVGAPRAGRRGQRTAAAPAGAAIATAE